MTKKVEEGLRRTSGAEILCTGVQVRSPAAPSRYYLPLVEAFAGMPFAAMHLQAFGLASLRSLASPWVVLFVLSAKLRL